MELSPVGPGAKRRGIQRIGFFEPAAVAEGRNKLRAVYDFSGFENYAANLRENEFPDSILERVVDLGPDDDDVVGNGAVDQDGGAEA